MCLPILWFRTTQAVFSLHATVPVTSNDRLIPPQTVFSAHGRGSSWYFLSHLHRGSLWEAAPVEAHPGRLPAARRWGRHSWLTCLEHRLPTCQGCWAQPQPGIREAPALLLHVFCTAQPMRPGSLCPLPAHGIAHGHRTLRSVFTTAVLVCKTFIISLGKQ